MALKSWSYPNIGRKELWNSESDFTSESGQVLNDAAMKGSLRTFELLLQHGARPELSLALHYAAKAEFSEERKTLMERLLTMGFDINQLDDAMGHRREGTPLYCAAARGRLQTVRFLLEHGADPSIENHRGSTAANAATKKRYQSTVNLLREWNAQDLESQ